jgi:hypothetical protein
MSTPKSRATSRRARLREEQIEELAIRGYTVRSIAAAVGMSKSGAAKALLRVEARALAASTGRAVREKTKQLDQLQLVFRESLEAWEKSKKESSTRTRKTIDGGESGARQVAEVKVADNVGDPRFLAEARGALADRRRILGIDAPVRLEQQMAVAERPAALLSSEEIDRQIAEHLERRPRGVH